MSTTAIDDIRATRALKNTAWRAHRCTYEECLYDYYL